MALIIAAKRTALGKVHGIFRHVLPENLVVPLMQELIKQTHAPLDCVILGNVLGDGNMARLATLQANLGWKIPALTIDTQCCSGIDAIATAVAYVDSGKSSCCLAGGVESTSLAPKRMRKKNPKQEEWSFYKRARFSPDDIGDPDMGESAEAVAKKFGISRDAQDAYALKSYQKTLASCQKCQQEILPISDSQSLIDELPRKMTLPILKRCSPVFVKNGTITAGNSCDDADGAAMVLVVSEELAKSLQITKALRVLATASVGVDPNLSAWSPVFVVEKLRQKGMSTNQLDLVELNEAFAVKALLFLQETGITPQVLNPRGGAIALGHAYGASGASLMVRAFHEVFEVNSQTQQGLAVLAAGGGIGTGIWFEKWTS